jgi:hypothetical protein
MSFTTIKNKELEVKKTKMTCDGCLAEDIPRPLPSHSHSMLYVGQAGSGKTNLMVSILSQHKKKGKRCGMAKVYDHIIIVSPSLGTLKNNIFKDLDENKKWEEFNDEMLDFVVEFTNKAVEEGETTLLILDDVTQQLKKSNALQKKLGYLLQNRRHRGLSVWCLIQRLIDAPTVLRESITHLILFRPINKREIELVSNEYLPVPKNEIQSLLNFVYSDKYNFLMIDMSLRYSSNFIYYKNFDEIIFD